MGVKAYTALERPFQQSFDGLAVLLGDKFRLRQHARREFFQNVVMQLDKVVDQCLETLFCFLAIGKAGFPNNAFRVINYFQAAKPVLSMAGDRKLINVSAFVNMPFR